MSPFPPWDPSRGAQASGRNSWDADLMICLSRTMVLAQYRVRIVPNGVLITPDRIPSACILWAAAWVDGGWRLIYHVKAQGLIITGIRGADPAVEIDPGLLANRAAYQADLAARAEEAAGALSGILPPCTRVRPAGRGCKLLLQAVPLLRGGPLAGGFGFQGARALARPGGFARWMVQSSGQTLPRVRCPSP